MTEEDKEVDGQDDTQDYFSMFGIFQDAEEKDQQLFNEIKEIIYEYVTRHGHDYTPELGEFRASSVGKCGRKTLLEKNPNQYMNEEDIAKIPELYRLRMFDQIDNVMEFGAHISGQVIHEAIQEALESRIISMEEEVTVEIGNFRLKGHYDLLIMDQTGEKVVIDIKSTSSSRDFLPKDMHLMQLMAYQGMMGNIRGGILYVNRNDWTMSYIPQKFDPDKFSDIVVKLTKMSDHESNHTLPPPVPEFDFECISMYAKCPFYDFCFPEDEAVNDKD